MNDTQGTGADEEVDLARLWGLLLDHWRVIVGGTAAVTLLGVLYAFLATPIHQADAMLHVESRKGAVPGLSEMAELFEEAPSAETEIQILRSRMVLGRAVDELSLDIAVRPVDRAFWKGAADNRALFASWRDEERLLRVAHLSVAEHWTGEPLILEVEEGNRFTLYHEDRALFSGEPGQDLETEQLDISLRVAELDAPPGTRFELLQRSRSSAIRGIRSDLSVSEQGRNTGILHVSLTGEHRGRVQALLDAVTRHYVMQNIERTAEEAERSLEFLQEQLPEIRAELNEAEDQLNRYRLEAESVDMSQETRALLERLVELETRLNELSMQEQEVARRYTREHPAYRTLIEQRRNLEAEKERLEARTRELPERQQQILRLQRDVELNQQIYLQLVNRAQELRVARAGTVGNVRIIDEAMLRPAPVQPRRRLVVALSFLLGGMLSVGGVLVRSALRRGIQSPEELEREGIPVYASLPLSERQQRLDRTLKRHRGHHVHPLLAVEDPADLAIEGVRSLRTSLHFALLEAARPILMISGPGPEVGKSFTTVNLAVVLAQVGQRVLVIDGDLRKGHLHGYFDNEFGPGLSDYLSGQTGWRETVRETAVENLGFIPRGAIAPNPSELLMHPRLEALFREAEPEYDLVLVDTPPVLAVTDAAIVGRQVGASLLVARYGQSTVREIEQTLRRFQLNGVEIKGVVVNCIERTASNYYDYYAYEYGKS